MKSRAVLNLSSALVGGFSLVPINGDVGRLIGVACDSDQSGAFAEVHQPDPLGLPTRLANLLGAGPDGPAGRGDRVELVVDVDDERPDKPPTSAVVLNGQHTLSAATLNRVVLQGRPLRVPTV